MRAFKYFACNMGGNLFARVEAGYFSKRFCPFKVWGATYIQYMVMSMEIYDFNARSTK
jgi:hypothetical protein